MLTLLKRSIRASQFGLWRQPRAMPFGVELSGNPLDGTYQMIARGAYGDFVYSSLLEAAPECVFLDIGANIGFFSVALANHFEGGVVAFEPSISSFSYLQQNLSHNDLHSVRAVCAGIWNTDEPSAILHTRRFHSGAASIARDLGGSSSRISLCGPTLLSSLVPADAPVAIKIDVEGAELQVIQGLKLAGLLDRANRVVVEMSRGTNDASNLDEIRLLLSEAGLDLASRHGTPNFGDELFIRRTG